MALIAHAVLLLIALAALFIAAVALMIGRLVLLGVLLTAAVLFTSVEHVASSTLTQDTRRPQPHGLPRVGILRRQNRSAWAIRLKRQPKTRLSQWFCTDKPTHGSC
jgi:hypothetical protein